MKIFYLPIPDVLKPRHQKFNYPKHNNDFGVEQIFDKFILDSQYLTQDINEADFHYLSIYWTRYFLNNNYGAIDLVKFNDVCNSLIINPSKTFTICQYDDGTLIDLSGVVTFLSSRKTKMGIDIPLISKELIYPWFRPKKKYLASFVGRLGTHSIRGEMAKALSGHDDIVIINQTTGTFSYTKLILSSHVSLCPRGYGGNSFRFFESMHLGTVPFLIGDLDTRPFKNYFNWDEFSLYSDDPDLIRGVIEEKSQEELIRMGMKSNKVYQELIQKNRWCEYVLLELNDIGRNV